MNLSQSNPIGLFDSGVGGTSIWKEVHQLLPNESTIYLADSKNAPYGQKSKDKIIEFCIKNTEYLLNKNAKIIIIACNTATTNAISVLRNKYNVPFIGIEPAIKPAGLVTKTKNIGILATQGTLNSELFEKTSGTINPSINIIERVGEGLVDLIENGNIESPEMDKLLSNHLKPMLKEKIDALVLGCTHYPYLIPKIKTIIGKNIQVIDSGLAVAKQTKNILIKHELLQLSNNSKTSHQFYSNTTTTVLKQLLDNNKLEVFRENF